MFFKSNYLLRGRPLKNDRRPRRSDEVTNSSTHKHYVQKRDKIIQVSASHSLCIHSLTLCTETVGVLRRTAMFEYCNRNKWKYTHTNREPPHTHTRHSSCLCSAILMCCWLFVCAPQPHAQQQATFTRGGSGCTLSLCVYMYTYACMYSNLKYMALINSKQALTNILFTLQPILKVKCCVIIETATLYTSSLIKNRAKVN